MKKGRTNIPLITAKIIVIIGVLFGMILDFSAQETLGNFIDDDGDCNIDCKDLEHAVRSFIQSNYKEASFVVGQDDFVSNTAGTDEFSMDAPYDIALDSTTNKVFVSDYNNHRILRFSSIEDFLYGNAIEAVFGQTNSTNNSTGLSASKFNQPTGIFVDHEGILWVADFGNSRILRFDDASNKSTGSAADGVLGQSSFINNSTAISSTEMKNPYDVLVSASGVLWVGDDNNKRVLRFDDAKNKLNGAAANGVLGAPDFTTNTAATANASSLSSASGMVLICGDLYVADNKNHRVLRWNDPETLANGASADIVLGQSNFTDKTASTAINRFNEPWSLATDKFNNLYVSDIKNERILVFKEVGSKTSGSNANNVLGQSNFTTSSSGLTSQKFSSPIGIAMIENGTRSYLAVCDESNHRVLVFGHDQYDTDELTSFSSTLPGADFSGSGGLSFFISAQPDHGTVTITNSSTGAFTYTPAGNCPYDKQYYEVFEYSLNNALDCYAQGEIIIRVSDVVDCPEQCADGVDNDEDCNTDCEDMECGTRAFEYYTGMDAEYVIGQSDFITNSSGTNDSKFDRPYDIVLDPLTSKVFVTDADNNRILRYGTYQEFIHGNVPEVVIGQTDFITSTSAASSSKLNQPAGIDIDNNGALWVADWGNNRVLRYDSASIILTGASANAVLGQTNFTNNGDAIGQNRMHHPEDVLVDDFGNLFVADQDNGRVLRFDAAAGKSNGANADGLLGQINYSTHSTLTDASTLSTADGLALVCNALYVSDFGHNRVLRWNDPESLTNGAIAVSVLGQSNFTASSASSSQSGLSEPRLLYADNFNNLYISENSSDRIVIHQEVNAKLNGANADIVLGQTSFTGNASGLSASQLKDPRGMCMIDNGYDQFLAVADGGNERVIVFGQDHMQTDEITPVSDVLPGYDPSGISTLTFAVIQQPYFGTIVIDDASTGAFTYTPNGLCPFGDVYHVSFTYSVTNAAGCSSTGERFIHVTDVGACVEVCGNTIDDDGDCNVDCADNSCGVRNFEFTNGMNSNFVVGQIDFTSNANATATDKFKKPTDIAVDPTSNKIFVSDTENHRVLRYYDYKSFIHGEDPEIVLGQVDFVSNTTGKTSTNMDKPHGIFVDQWGVLWVADRDNHRVLKFNDASNLSSNSAADIVLGQTDFISDNSGRSSLLMNKPFDMVMDEDGNLFVTDRDNGRVLRFDNANAKSNGAPADGVLGQENFIKYNDNSDKKHIHKAEGLVMVCNSLYVSDRDNNRVLRWDNPAMLIDGADAIMVMGQPDLDSDNAKKTQNGMEKPGMLATDKYNNLYVSDVNNHRVLIFHEVNAKTNGNDADVVIGQTDFVSNGDGLAVDKFKKPHGISILDNGDGQFLAIVDKENHRVMVIGTEDLATDEISPLSSTLYGYDPSGSGGLTFSIDTQPAFGTVTIDNASTGAYTYTPHGYCPYDRDYQVSFIYEVSNANDCSTTATLTIDISDVGLCVETCGNGIDDDLDCNVDCEDLECGTRAFELANGMDASFVIGQNDYITGTPGINQDSFDGMYNIAVDPITKKVFIADTFNNRVLRYASYNDFVYGISPEIVLGQVDFVSKVMAVTATGMNEPTGITVDNTGTLWVADWNNNRVLRFDNASNIGTSAPADGVLGQLNFTANSASTTAATMDYPVDLVVDENGNLFVAEQRNGRVLRFDNAASKVNGASADGLLGETTFTGDSPETNAVNLEYPCGIALICNSLYVSDFNKNRILRWDNPASLANGAPAIGVLGQADFTSSTSGLSQSAINEPRILSSDSKNNLYLADGNNHRVLVYNEVNAKSDGDNADIVIGQPDFVTNTTGLDQNSFNEPRGIAIIENGTRSYLSVADRDNNRILLFGTPEYSTDEVTNISGIFEGYDPSGSGGLNFSIVTDPIYGAIVIDNATTGAFTYTPDLICSTNSDVYDEFTYEVSNSNGCSETGQLMIFVTDLGPCVEDCSNGLDDDLNGLTDRLDPNCDFDGDSVLNIDDFDNDNDGLLDSLESNVSVAQCPYTVSRTLYANDFGTGLRTSSSNAKICYENGSGVTCSSTYDESSYSNTVERGEYTVINNSDDANQGNYNWVSTNDESADPNGRMIIFNPSFVGQILFEFRVDAIVPNVDTYLSLHSLNLFSSGAGMQLPRMIINVLDTNSVVLHSTQIDMAETGFWYNSGMLHSYGNNTSVIFQFVNDQPTMTGNDFAIDNIILTQNLRDCDNDGIANMYDLDSDNDGITDIAEQNGADSDFNGITDNITLAMILTNDINNNGVDDTYEGQPVLDTDLDLVLDIHDLDSDNDGIYDVIESKGIDSDYDGLIGTGVMNDDNGNGLNDIVDPSESGTGLPVVDSDTDGNPDMKEFDSDNDGCNDVTEAGFPDGDANGFLGIGTIGSGLIVNSQGKVVP